MPSIQMQYLKNIMHQMMSREGMPSFNGKGDPMILRATIEASQKGMPTEPGVDISSVDLGGVPGEICTPKNPRQDGVIVYIHGGGLICGNAQSSRGYASMLAKETGLPVYTLSYRLAPENPYPAAVEDCATVYQALLHRHPGLPIALLGESGGATLCLTTTLKAKEAGWRLPTAIIPYSPVVDLSGALDRSGNEGKDFTVTQKGLDQLRGLYCPDQDLRNPFISTLFADYQGFPPMFLGWDNSETLAIDSERLKEKALEAGVTVEGRGYDDCFHAFATAGRGTPESAEILANTVAFIDRYFGVKGSAK